MFFARRIRLSHSILLPYAFIFVLAGLYVAARPYITTFRTEKIARELKERYGLVVRYGDPSEFFIPPYPPADKGVDYLKIERVDPRCVLTALEGIRNALQMYPPGLIKKYISAVFVTGPMKMYGSSIAAMYHRPAAKYHRSWIYVSGPRSSLFGLKSYALSLHHELSSFFFYDYRLHFPANEWTAVNDKNFKYMGVYKFLRATASGSGEKRNQEEAKKWYRSGFVDDYGMASLEDDFNMYAEMVMGDSEYLKEVVKRYPKVAQKTKIVVDFYSRIDPKLHNYLNASGLTEAVKGIKLPSINSSPLQVRVKTK
jgi:hypothetical protein